MKYAGVILVAWAAVASSLAQSPVTASGTFQITQTNPVISTSTISGKQQYKILATADGYTISSHLWVAEGETPVFSEVEESLAPDWSLRHYVFNGLVGGIKQKFEVSLDGGKVHIQVTSERMNPQRWTDLGPNTVVLDNFVPSNFQVLLNRFAVAESKTPGLNSLQLNLIVPQRLLALKGTLSRSGSDSGVINRNRVELHKYILQAPGVKAEVWANEQNRLLGVYFAGPDVEYLQDHFDLPQLKLAMKKTLPSEHPVSFLSHGRPLLGTLMLPPESLGKKGRYPTVVLVAGFGPVDRDETVGRSKPLRDIAVGLANKGIATLRYDKPTYSFRGRLDPAHLTIDEETIDAAAAATAFARTVPETDPENIFLLGHSEGGELAPFILEKARDVRGAILMAVPGRPPEQFLPEQLAAGLKMRGLAQEKIEPRVRTVTQQLAAIRKGEQSSATVLDMPAGFWRSLMERNSIAALREIKVPVLVLQGERDNQVSKKDFELVTSAVPSSQLESEYFGGLDHIFAPAPEDSAGSEILIGAHVAGQVIDRISSWVERHRAGAAVDMASRSGEHR